MILIFDLSGVVFNKGLKIAVEKICKDNNLEKEDVKFVLNGSFSHDYRTGKIKTKEFWIKAKEHWKHRDIESIKNIFFESYTLQNDIVEFIKKIKSKGIKIGYLSNGPKDRTEYLDKKFGFISIFDFGLFSFEANSIKPEKEIFEKLINKQKIDPKDSIYIDDKESNLLPAKELGMKIIHFININQLKDELAKLKIEV